MAQGPFISDIKELRRRARQHIEKGAVTEGYKVDRETALKLLNEALATEIVCVLRYKRHYYAATGLNSEGVKAEFLEHAGEEQMHADQISERITQLGGEPNLNPEGMLSRSHSEYVEGTSLVDMIKEDLVAERTGTAPVDASAVLQPVMIVWSVAALAGLFLLGVRYAERRTAGSDLDRALALGSDRSFGVFLVHPAILREIMPSAADDSPLSSELREVFRL